jgi:putative protease
MNRRQESDIIGKIELLSPCGSPEALQAAIQAGADAVYFGVEQLNMRARSGINFTVEDMKVISSQTKKHGMKAYLTLNTILYDHDLSLMREIIDSAVESGVDAVIASDISVIAYARKKGIPVHISTQANVSNIEAVEFFSAFADVIVLARELTLEQVSQITKYIKRKNICGPSGKLIRIEIFAHGALCMAISGKCYMSLHSHFASANRGACIQNCRRSYVVKDQQEDIEFVVDNEYIMSAKDLCTIEFVDKLIDSGISVLKIEGRGRSEEYVHSVTQSYREAIDAVAEGTYTPDKIEVWKGKLSSVFNRGFWDGYYLGKKMGEWADDYGSKATKKKIFIGQGLKYFDQIGVGEFRIESNQLKVGDEIMISGPTTGIIYSKIDNFRINDEQAILAKKGDIISFPVVEKIRPSDKLYKIIEAVLSTT